MSQIDSNRLFWDAIAEIHSRNESYGLRELLEKGSTLRRIEKEYFLSKDKLSDLDIIHSHCHLGYDSISLAKLGIGVYGVDFSNTAICEATRLSKRLGINCQFAVINDWKELLLDEQRDVFFASYGILDWIDDLNSWFSAAYKNVRHGGELVIIDGHPVFNTMIEEYPRENVFRITDPYSTNGAPWDIPMKALYSDRKRDLSHFQIKRWKWSLSDVFNCAIRNNFILTDIKEFNFSHYKRFNSMNKNDDGYYELSSSIAFPQLFKSVFRKV